MVLENNAAAILEYGHSQSGKVERDAFKFYLKASSTTDGLGKVYTDIELIVRNAMRSGEVSSDRFDECHFPLDFTEDEIRNESKSLILAMQGMWTAHHTYSWPVCNANYEEDCPAKVRLTRENGMEHNV